MKSESIRTKRQKFQRENSESVHRCKLWLLGRAVTGGRVEASPENPSATPPELLTSGCYPPNPTNWLLQDRCTVMYSTFSPFPKIICWATKVWVINWYFWEIGDNSYLWAGGEMLWARLSTLYFCLQNRWQVEARLPRLLLMQISSICFSRPPPGTARPTPPITCLYTA